MNNPRNIVYKKEAREKLLNGVNQLADAVSCTLGPSGRTVLIMTALGQPHPTKDGVSVARQVYLSDPHENAGAQMVREASTRVAEEAGDGTTTATVLARSFAVDGCAYADNGYNVTLVKRFIDRLVNATVDALKAAAVPGSSPDIVHAVAKISANGDDLIADNIRDAVLAVGEDGVVTVEESDYPMDELTITDGLSFDRGYLTPYFINHPERNEYIADTPVILVTDLPVDNIQELESVLTDSRLQNRAIVIIADSFSQQATQLMALNANKGVVNLCAIMAPSFGERRREVLKDIATIIGATFISEQLGHTLSDVTLDHLGSAVSIKVSRNETIILQGHGVPEEIEARRSIVRKLHDDSLTEFDREKLQERLGMLSGKAAVIKVGGHSELEMKEKKDRYDDAVHAVRAAIVEGVLPGGGYGLWRVATEMLDKQVTSDKMSDEEAAAFNIFTKAIIQPLMTIRSNRGLTDELDVAKMLTELKPGQGYDLEEGHVIDLISSGIVDPLRVTRLALETGASVGSMIMTTDCVIVEEPYAPSGRRAGIMS